MECLHVIRLHCLVSVYYTSVQLSLGLRVRGADHKHIVEVTFEPTCSKALCRGPVNLAVSIHHYIKLRYIHYSHFAPQIAI